MHRTGERTQWTPVADASIAVTRAARSISSGSQLAAIASWVGKMVAPGQKEWPWMQSSTTSSGMPRRDRAASAIAWGNRSGEAWRMAPACLRSDDVLEVVLVVGVQLQQLADLLLRGHAGDQVVDPFLDVEGRVEVGSCPGVGHRLTCRGRGG